MLTFLQLKDFAIVEAAELELGGGLTALTGETGAGKSILVDAVMAVIGGRAGADVVRHGAERAEISATFDVAANPEARGWLSEQSIEHDGEVALRRVIGRDGRSRLYVNGQVMAIGVVRELGARLIDIHGQSEFLSLLRRESQRALLDDFGDTGALAAPLASLAAEWREVTALIGEWSTRAHERVARLELLRYQVLELDQLGLTGGDVAALIEERTRLAHGGRLAEAARSALSLLYEGAETDAHSLASKAAAALRSAQALDGRLQAPLKVLEEALIALKESGLALSDYLDDLEVDPRRQEQVEHRLATVEELARKHRVSAEELPALHGRLRQECALLESAGTSVAELEARARDLLARYRTAAAALTGARQRAAEALSAAVTGRMHELGMPGGSFLVTLATSTDGEPRAHGADEVEFLVSANPGQPPKPVARVASGGELSRISLSVQVASVAGRPGAACMIFDEVDAGVGGAVAEMVGRQLHALGARGQVLCVTHLPQVASQADHQVRVEKVSAGNETRTELRALDGAARIEELARMLGGVEITDSARRHAKALLRARG